MTDHQQLWRRSFALGAGRRRCRDFTRDLQDPTATKGGEEGGEEVESDGYNAHFVSDRGCIAERRNPKTFRAKQTCPMQGLKSVWFAE